jgi:hypothetical protein
MEFTEDEEKNRFTAMATIMAISIAVIFAAGILHDFIKSLRVMGFIFTIAMIGFAITFIIVGQ